MVARELCVGCKVAIRFVVHIWLVCCVTAARQIIVSFKLLCSPYCKMTARRPENCMQSACQRRCLPSATLALSAWQVQTGLRSKLCCEALPECNGFDQVAALLSANGSP
jgi:hypothetical protein